MPRNSAQQNNMSRVPTAAKLRGTTLMIIMPTWEDDGRIMPTWEDVATRGVMGQSIHGHRIQLSRPSIKKNNSHTTNRNSHGTTENCRSSHDCPSYRQLRQCDHVCSVCRERRLPACIHACHHVALSPQRLLLHRPGYGPARATF